MIDDVDAIDRPVRRRHVLLLVLLPAVLQAATVVAFGSRMLIWDEFVYTNAFREIGEGRPWLYWILAQHNEHRIVWTKLVMFAHAGISGWNPIVDMYVSAALTALIAWGIWKLYRAAGAEHPAYFVAVALLLCSLAQYMNILYGLMTCHYFTLAGMIWAIVFLMRRTRASVAAAIACACAAMLSTLNAVVIAPIGLLVLVMTRQPPARRIAWIAAMLGFVTAYFIPYQRPGQMPAHEWSASTVLRMADALVVSLGSPLSGFDLVWARALGVMTAGALVLLWVCVWRLGRRESHAGVVALGLMAVGCAAAVALGRAWAGVETALESKYIGYSTLALAGTYLGFVCLPRLRARAAIVGGLTAVMTVGLMAANMAGFERVRTWRVERQRSAYLIQRIEMLPDDSARTIFGVATPQQIRTGAAYLRATRLGPFRDEMDALIPPRWLEGLPTEPVTAGAPVRAHILCPVDTLVDVGLSLSRLPGGAETGSVQVSVTAGGRIVGRRRADVRDLQGVGHVRIDLDAPLRGCRGTDLIVEATSEAADGAGAILAWTYPVYYAGVTRQRGRPIDQRGLGVTFNAFSNGLIP